MPEALLDSVLIRLHGVHLRAGDRGASALCPAHDDTRASLSVGLSDDGSAVLLKCFAGCTFDAIVSALDLQPGDLFVNGSAPRRAHRRAPRPEPDEVIVVQGVDHWQALDEAGHTAVGIDPPNVPSDDELEMFRGSRVYLWPTTDEAHRQHLLAIGQRLRGVAAEVRLVTVPTAGPGEGADDVNPNQYLALLSAARPLAAVLSTRGGIDAADLMDSVLPPLLWVVPGLLPEGTTILAGPPKVGKSALVYQIAVEVALGGALFGQRVEPGVALYLALEDGPRRGQDRLRAVLAGRTMPHGRLQVEWGAPKIGEGLVEYLDNWLGEHSDSRLVAIDTLAKVRPPSNGKRNPYEVDVEDLGRLQDLFRDRQVSLTIAHHARKESTDDFLTSVSGTYGITGSADTIAVIRRKRLETFGTIVVTGRDVAETTLHVRFDDTLWSVAPASLPQTSFERSEVFQTIEHHGPIFATGIAQMTGLSRQSVQNMLALMLDDGALVRVTKGYQIAPQYSQPSRVEDA